MRIISGFCVREILDEIIAIPSEGESQQFSGIISLNEVGRLLFEALYEEQTEESLVALVVSEYEVDEQTAAADVKEFLDDLRKSKLLIE